MEITKPSSGHYRVVFAGDKKLKGRAIYMAKKFYLHEINQVIAAGRISNMKEILSKWPQFGQNWQGSKAVSLCSDYEDEERCLILFSWSDRLKDLDRISYTIASI